MVNVKAVGGRRSGAAVAVRRITGTGRRLTAVPPAKRRARFGA